MNDSIDKIIEKIKTASTPRGDKSPLNIFWDYGIETQHGMTPEILALNTAFRNLPMEEGVQLAKDVLTLYVAGAHGPRMFNPSLTADEMQKVKTIFGHAMDPEVTSRFQRTMATLTRDRKEFRIWYSPPGKMRWDHVDAGGEGLVLAVESHEAIAHYVADDWMKHEFQRVETYTGPILYFGRWPVVKR